MLGSVRWRIYGGFAVVLGLLALVTMADTLEAETQTTIDQIGGSTSAMAVTAHAMRASAARTGEAAANAMEAAGPRYTRSAWQAGSDRASL
jgi:hypothetical protein